MKITVNQKVLKSIIEDASKASTDTRSLSILENVLIEAADNKITITGNNMTMAIKSSGPAIVEESGSICFVSKLLNDIVKKLPNDSEVVFETIENNILKINCGSVKLKHSYVSSEAFPDFPNVEDGVLYNLPANKFKRALKGAFVGAAKDGTHDVLKGCYIDIFSDYINVLGIDGFRVSMQKITGSFGEIRNANIPYDSVKELIKLIPEVGDLQVMLSPNYATFTVDNTTILTRLINGNYINYNTIIPREFPIKIKLNRTSLIDSLERISLLTGSEKTPTRMTITENTLTTYAYTKSGEISEPLALSEKSGDDLVIAFNNEFLLEGLKLFNSEEITFEYLNATSPSKITDDSNESVYIALPVRIVS